LQLRCIFETNGLPYIVEYASVIWSPHTSHDKTILEGVQQKAARFVCNDFSSYSIVSSMLDKLGWNSLEDRRSVSRLTMFYKIIHNIIEADFSTFLHPARQSRGHKQSLTIF